MGIYLTLYLMRVDQSKEQHLLGINLLEELGLNDVRLEPQRDGRYRYVAWTVPLVEGNGRLRLSRQGIIAQRQK